jgi:phosphoserine phosphatase
MQRNVAPNRVVPLCVDLDGTLIQTDLLIESWFALLQHSTLNALLAPFWLFRGKARLKREIAERAHLDVGSLPYNSVFLEYLQRQHQEGRVLVLTTASDEKFARQVAEHLGIFAEVLSSDGHINLKGLRKRQLLTERFGEGGFDYAGNGRADLEVFPYARQSIVVGPESGVEEAAK